MPSCSKFLDNVPRMRPLDTITRWSQSSRKEAIPLLLSLNSLLCSSLAYILGLFFATNAARCSCVPVNLSKLKSQVASSSRFCAENKKPSVKGGK